MIFTFYSFKGGVGRSMALANIAEYFYRLGLRVLVVDWDLEAPGLENFFFSPTKEREVILAQLGLIDLLTDYKRHHLQFTSLLNRALEQVKSSDSELSISRANQDNPQLFKSILQDNLSPISYTIYPVHPENKDDQGNKSGLWLLPAGWRSGDRFNLYAQTVQAFDWAEFYANYHGEAYFEWFREQLECLADIVLIDSRTGVTEMGGVCTRQLADVVVAICVPTDQNLEGIVRMAESFTREDVIRQRNGRKLEVLIIPSRLEVAQIEDRNRFEKKFRQKTDAFTPRAFLSVKSSFWDLGIPYVPKFAYLEALAVGDPKRQEYVRELEEVYIKISRHLGLLTPTSSKLRSRLAPELQDAFGEQLPRLLIAYSSKDGYSAAEALRQRLEIEGYRAFFDQVVLNPGVNIRQQITTLLEQVKSLLLVITDGASESEWMRLEYILARRLGVCVYPIKPIPSLKTTKLPEWLSDQLIYDPEEDWIALVDALGAPCAAPRIPYMVPELSSEYIHRPAQEAQLLNILLEHADSDKASPVVVTGMGGCGKTTLVRALCQAERLQGIFNDGILWVPLGQKPDLLKLIGGCINMLAKERPTLIDLQDATREFVSLLGDRRILIVIDDLWDYSHIKPFMQGGSRCVRLITTRNLHTLPPNTTIFTLDVLEIEQSVALLTNNLEITDFYLKPFHELANLLGNLPLALELARGVLRQRLGRGDSLDGALDYLHTALDRKGVVAFDSRDAIERSQALTLSLQVSLDLLDNDEKERFSQIAILLEDVPIPLEVVSILWGLDKFDTQNLVERLTDLSLLIYDFPGRILRLHNIIREYLSLQLSDPRKLHQSLIDAYAARFPKGWPSASNDGYLFQSLSYHLLQAGRVDELRRLLLDYEWLQAKLKHTDVYDLLVDYARYLAISQSGKEAEIERLERAIRQTARILRRDPGKLAGQLHGWLLDDPAPEVQALLAQAIQSKADPWLRPLTASLHEPEAIVRIPQGHTDPVLGVAVTPDGRQAISASLDRTLIVWDLESGQAQRTLQGHANSVTSVAATPDGRQAISASLDKTLIVWDLESGQAQRTLQGHANSVTSVAVTPDGVRAVSTSWDKTLIVWDLESALAMHILQGHIGRITSVAVTPDGRQAISASLDKTLIVWDLESGQAQRTLQGHVGFVTSVALTPDGARAVSASWDKTLIVWDLESGQAQRIFRGHTGSVTGVTVTPDGRWIVSVSSDYTLIIWELESGHLVVSFNAGEALITCAVVPDARTFVVGGQSGRVHFLRLEGMGE